MKKNFLQGRSLIQGLCKALGGMTLLFVLLTACDNKSNETVSQKPTIKIGVSLPMSGDAAYIGEPSKHSAMMALEKWKKRDTKYNYELVFEDDQYSLKTSRIVANKMIAIDGVKAIITIWDISAPVNMVLSKQHNIIHLGCTWGNNMSDGINNFNNVSSHDEHAKKMIEMLKSKGVKKIGYVNQVIRGDIDLKENMKKEFEKNEIELVYEEEFHIGNKDFKMFFAQIKNKPVDMLIITMLPDDFAVFVKQKKEARNITPMTTVDYFESIPNKELAEGAYYVISAPGKEQFVKEISKHTNVIGQCIANVNSSVDLLIHAFENAETDDIVPSTAEVVAAMHKVDDLDTVLGNISVEKNGHIESEAIIRKIENGVSVDVD